MKFWVFYFLLIIGRVRELHASIMTVSLDLLLDDGNSSSNETLNSLLLSSNLCLPIRTFPTNGVNSNKPHPIALTSENSIISQVDLPSNSYDFGFGRNATTNRSAEEALTGINNTTLLTLPHFLLTY